MWLTNYPLLWEVFKLVGTVAGCRGILVAFTQARYCAVGSNSRSNPVPSLLYPCSHKEGLSQAGQLAQLALLRPAHLFQGISYLSAALVVPRDPDLPLSLYTPEQIFCLSSCISQPQFVLIQMVSVSSPCLGRGNLDRQVSRHKSDLVDIWRLEN